MSEGKWVYAFAGGCVWFLCMAFWLAIFSLAIYVAEPPAIVNLALGIIFVGIGWSTWKAMQIATIRGYERRNDRN